jgi:heavy metal sensor kinase
MSRWWQPRTLRFRLALWYGIGGAALLAGYSGGIYLFIARYLPVEARLRRDAVAVRNRLTARSDQSIDWDRHPILPPDQWGSEHPWFELWDENGRLILRHWPFADRPLDNPLLAPQPGRDVVTIYNVASDLRLRMIAMPFAGPEGRPWMLRVMRVHEAAVDIMASFRLILWTMLPLVVAALVAGGYALTRYWLRPFDRMADEVDRIGADDLSRRVSVPENSAEIGRVAARFNQTLERLENAFGALDRFVADASHELRTPLTALSNVGELGLKRSRSPEEYREIIGSMLEEADRLRQLTQRLLELARVGGGAETPRRVRVWLNQEMSACLDDLAILAEMRNQRLSSSGPPCAIETDPVIFRQALLNVVDNAIKYSPEGSAITVTLTVGDEQVVIAVEDEGAGIAAEHRTLLARRFFRADHARERSGGFGLGLAITQAYLRILGGSLEYEPRVPRGSIFRLKLPLGLK